MAILVVGGAGYIGSHIVRALQQSNRDAVVFDNLEKGHREAIPDVPLYEGDLRNKEDVRAVLKTITSMLPCTFQPTVLLVSQWKSLGFIMRTTY